MIVNRLVMRKVGLWCWNLEDSRRWALVSQYQLKVQGSVEHLWKVR
jgi:hypothetical protein